MLNKTELTDRLEVILPQAPTIGGRQVAQRLIEPAALANVLGDLVTGLLYVPTCPASCGGSSTGACRPTSTVGSTGSGSSCSQPTEVQRLAEQVQELERENARLMASAHDPMDTVRAVAAANMRWVDAFAEAFPSLGPPREPSHVRPFLERSSGTDGLMATLNRERNEHKIEVHRLQEQIAVLSTHARHLEESLSQVGRPSYAIARAFVVAGEPLRSEDGKKVEQMIPAAINRVIAKANEVWRTAFRQAGEPLGSEAGITEAVTAVLRRVAEKARARAEKSAARPAHSVNSAVFYQAFANLGVPLDEDQPIQDAVLDVLRAVYQRGASVRPAGAPKMSDFAAQIHYPNGVGPCGTSTDQHYRDAFAAAGYPLGPTPVPVAKAVRDAMAAAEVKGGHRAADRMRSESLTAVAAVRRAAAGFPFKPDPVLDNIEDRIKRIAIRP